MVRTPKKKCLYPKTFFQVFLPDQSSHHMQFPLAFIKYFSGNIPFKSKIIGPMKSSWQVDLLKVDDSLYFQKGWNQFVLDNSLGFGDFLVFSFDGNALFRVKIYGPNGCERKPMSQAEESFPDSSNPVENHADEKRENPNRLDLATNSKQFDDDDDDEKNVQNASEFKSDDRPVFRIVMKHSYVYRGSLKFPPECLKCCGCIVSLKSMISTIKGSWRVDLEYIDKILYFRNGWEQFVQDNSLRFGDFLVFNYGGNGKFDVEIYGSDGCEKEVTHYIEDSSRGFPISDNNQKDENSEDVCGKRVGRPRVLANKEKTLSFEVVMKKYHKRCLTIPKPFVSGAGIEHKKFVLLFKNGNLWPVNICKRTYAGSGGRIDTSTGWRKFWDDNKLTLNSKCMFKFVPGSGNIIQVDIAVAK